MVSHAVRSLLLLLLLTATPVVADDPPADPLSPASWPPAVRAGLQRADDTWGTPPREVLARREMVVGTTGPTAIRAGLAALEAGGNACDAALVTALAQVAQAGGCWVSYAGILGLVYFDAATGQVHALDAGYQTIRGEPEGSKIPKTGGRTVLVPGFMAGVEAAHGRLGALPFGRLFVPAIGIAEHGVPLGGILPNLIRSKAGVLRASPEAAAVFARPGGGLLRAGDRFVQPRLAATLRQVATHGAAHMYRGAWARKLVAVARTAGSRLTAEELAAYRPSWAPPRRADYRGVQIMTAAGTSVGGINLVEAFNLLGAVDLRRLGDPLRSDASLYRLILASRFNTLLTILRPPGRRAVLAELGVAPLRPLRAEDAATVWPRLLDGDWRAALRGRVRRDVLGAGKHSDGVVVWDRHGNVAALTHSINTASWGHTGLFVDGVSIPDSASFQQRRIAEVGPGRRLPNEMCPVIVLRDGRPLLASSAIGAGLHEVTLQALVAAIDFGIEPHGAANRPHFVGPLYSQLRLGTQGIVGRFPPRVLDGVRRRGQAVSTLAAAGQEGYWIGIAFDPESGMLRGGNAPRLNGIGLGR